MPRTAATMDAIDQFRQRRSMRPIDRGYGIDHIISMLDNVRGGWGHHRWHGYGPEVSTIAVGEYRQISATGGESHSNYNSNRANVYARPIRDAAPGRTLHPQLTRILWPANVPTPPGTAPIAGVPPTPWRAHDGSHQHNNIPLSIILTDRRMTPAALTRAWATLPTSQKALLVECLSRDITNAASHPVIWSSNPFLMDYYFRSLQWAAEIPLFQGILAATAEANERVAELQRQLNAALAERTALLTRRVTP